MTEESTNEFKLEPFKLFQIYHAVFLHFTTDYDYQKYHGKTAYKKDTFEHRKDKYSFHKLVRVLMAHHINYVYFEYYLSWLHLNEEKWVTTALIESKVNDFEHEWRKYSDSRLTYFQADAKKIQSLEPEHLFALLQTGEIHTQTLLILNQIWRGLIGKMNDALKGRYLWDRSYKKLLKFIPFYLTFEPVNDAYFRQHIPETLKWADPEQ